MNCLCCSGKSYSDCCKLFHLNKKLPKTAEELMRSRYCAYAIPNGEYLILTTLPSERRFHSKQKMQEWGGGEYLGKTRNLKQTFGQSCGV